MTPASAADQVIKAAAETHDPVVMGLSFVLAVVIIVIAISKPIMGLVRDYKKTGADNAKSEAEATLYDQLQRQIQLNTKAIESIIKEKDEWIKKALYLEQEVERLKVFETMVNSMKDRLAEKDRLLETRDNEIRTLMRTILEMKDKIHSLELRLTMDEQRFCANCTRKEAE